MNTDLLANITWAALAGPHAAHALGTGQARRYRPGFAALMGFADPHRPELDALRAHACAGERLFCDGWAGAQPAQGWQLESETVLARMVWQGPLPGPASAGLAFERLGRAQAAEVQALVQAAAPGPFGLEGLQLGESLGLRDAQGRLVAMACERLFAGPYREIASVATHPDARGRGLASALVRELVQRQRARGEVPFLHVRCNHASAIRLYERLGFRTALVTPARAMVAQ
ncbi:MAG: GNAT family N-acetyltransferase [Inhella sp.]